MNRLAAWTGWLVLRKIPKILFTPLVAPVVGLLK